jgi:hypothetical protein
MVAEHARDRDARFMLSRAGRSSPTSFTNSSEFASTACRTAASTGSLLQRVLLDDEVCNRVHALSTNSVLGNA